MEIQDSRLGQFNAIHGKNNVLNSVYLSVAQKERAGAPSVFDCLAPLPNPALTDPGATAYLADDLRDRAAALKRDRLLLITSSNESFLRGATAALIETLAIPAARRKLLNFMAPVSRGFMPTLVHFLAARPEAEEELLVVVDATGDLARQFIDSLFAIRGATTYDYIRDSLVSQRLSLICYIDSARYSRLPARELRRFPFECWNVPYVQYLLRPYYPEDYGRLDATIAEQRKRGRWASSNFDFHEQIREQAEAGNLERVVAEGGIAAYSRTPEFFPDPSQPIHMAAVYTATYFENLSPADFNRVVALLLGRRTRIDMQREIPLVDIWRDEADSILRDCRLVTTKQPQRIVSFETAGSRDRFRSHFETRYGLFVQTQFQNITDHALHLDSSDRVAENTRLLILDRIAGSAEDCNPRWLCELIASAVKRAAHEPTHAYRRIAQLLSDLWTGHPALVRVVLDELIDTGAHDAAFEILRSLRPKSGLEELAYVSRILERGSEATREKVRVALACDLRGPGLFATLRALEAWRPPAEAQALRLVLESFVEAATRYDLADYGKWPTGFPLLDVTSEEMARDHFALLARWLLHPRLGSAFDTPVSAEAARRIAAALISEWAFILLGPSAPSPAGFSAEDALRILLEEIVVRSGPSLHRGVLRDMLDYWTELKEVLLSVANDTDDDAVRRQVQWKHRVIRRLLGYFDDRG